MQLYEIVYEPRKGMAGTPVTERLPLDRGHRRIGSEVRALHPNHKITQVRPIGAPLKDRGQYHYWTLGFRYHEGPYVGILGDDEHSQKASRALCDAERIVAYALTRLAVEHQPQYAWPNGSLYYSIRLPYPYHNIDELVPALNEEMRKLHENPVTTRWSYTYDKKRKHLKNVFGKMKVEVDEIYPIKNPFEQDPHKGGYLNYIDYFETPPLWAQKGNGFDDSEDFKNKQHQAFRMGFEEAFGHQRLFHYHVRPTEHAVKFANAQPASEEECAAYVGAYALGKVLLTLALPDGVEQKPWRLLFDEGQTRDF